MSGKRLYLTKEQALSVLPDKEEVHTFYNVPPTLIGADWSKDEIIDIITKLSKRFI